MGSSVCINEYKYKKYAEEMNYIRHNFSLDNTYTNKKQHDFKKEYAKAYMKLLSKKK